MRRDTYKLQAFPLTAHIRDVYLEEGEPGRVDHYCRVRVRERQGSGRIKGVNGEKETGSVWGEGNRERCTCVGTTMLPEDSAIVGTDTGTDLTLNSWHGQCVHGITWKCIQTLLWGFRCHPKHTDNPSISAKSDELANCNIRSCFYRINPFFFSNFIASWIIVRYYRSSNIMLTERVIVIRMYSIKIFISANFSIVTIEVNL